MSTAAPTGVALERELLSSVPTQLLVGDWSDAAGSRRFPVRNPATGQDLCSVADASPADALEALALAANTQESWASTAPRDRAEILRAAFEAVCRRVEELELLITLEMGKPLAEARAEVAYGAEFLRWYSEEGVRLEGRFAHSPDGQGRILVTRKPVGPCLLITPWNFPLAMATRKLAPALAAGCTCVLKPASETPLSCLLLAEILLDAGLPAGVLGVVTTSSSARVFTPLIRDPRARKLSFTGSTEVGKVLTREASEQLLRVSMELGGNAPFLVFDDADLDRAVAGAVIAKTRNTGESCVAANRFLVQERLAPEFTSRLVDAMRKLVVGTGTEPGVEIGPLINDRAVDSTSGLVERMCSQGGEVLLGGNAIKRSGSFFSPTVVSGVERGAPVAQEEIFAPVASVMTFADEDDAVAQANATDSGLAAYLFTESVDRALRLIDRLDFGMIGLNKGVVSNAAAPFGGIKQSGQGREGGPEGMAEYTELTYVAVDA